MQYLLVALLNRLTHTAMAMSALFFVLFRRVPSTDIALFTVRLLCICVNAREKCAKSYRAEGHFHVCTQGQSVAECTKRGRAAVIVVLFPVPLTQPSQLFSLSATLAHMPVSCNCGLIHSLSIIFFSFFFSWTTLFCLCPVVLSLLMICLPAFFSSLSPAPLLQSFTPSFSPFFLFLLLFFSLSSCRPNVRLCE